MGRGDDGLKTCTIMTPLTSPGAGLRAQLTRAGIGSLTIKVVHVFLGLLLAIVLARSLGPEGYGIYSFVFAVISILSIPAQFGLPRLVVRETAKTLVNEEWGLMRGIWHWANTVAGVMCIILVLAAFGTLWLMADRFSQLQHATFLWGLVLMPLIVFGALRDAALQGLLRVVLGRLPETILRPGGYILALLITIWWSSPEQITASTAMSLRALVAGLALLVSIWLLRHSRPDPLVASPIPVYETRLWLATVLPFALTAGMQQVNKYTDIIMLGYFMTAEEVGVYRVAVQGAILVIFGLQTVNMFVLPYFARMHMQEDHKRLQKLVTMCARASLLAALPIVLVFVFWGEAIICTFFGSDYINAYLPLVILASGQFVNALFGPVGILLNMTGHQRDTLRGIMIAAGANILLNLALIPTFGLNGAAIATALTFIIWNVSLWLYAKKRIDLNTTAF